MRALKDLGAEFSLMDSELCFSYLMIHIAFEMYTTRHTTSSAHLKLFFTQFDPHQAVIELINESLKGLNCH